MFGSKAKGRAREQSDLDLAILSSSNTLENALQRALRWTVQAADALRWPDEKIDVVDLRTAPVLLAHEALCTGQLIFDRNPAERIEFQMASLHRAEEARHLLHIATSVHKAQLQARRR